MIEMTHVHEAFRKDSRLHHHPIGVIHEIKTWTGINFALHSREGDDSSWWVLRPEEPIRLLDVKIATFSGITETFVGSHESGWPYPQGGMWVDAICKATVRTHELINLRDVNSFVINVRWEHGHSWVIDYHKQRGDMTTNVRTHLTKILFKFAPFHAQAQYIVGHCEF